MTVALTRAEISQQLRKALGFRGQASFVAGEEIIPVVIVADASQPPFLEGAVVGGVGSSSIGPVAAQFSTVGVILPATANEQTRARVRLIHLSATGGVVGIPVKIAVGVFAGIVLSTNVNGTWDATLEGPPQARAGGINLAAAVVGSAACFLTTAAPSGAAGAPTAIERDWILTPGQQLVCEMVTANIGLQGAFYWEEYLVG